MIHKIVEIRMRLDPETVGYIEGRTIEGESRREIRRCLKRYVTRQIFDQLEKAP